jgi:hypothetical protein
METVNFRLISSANKNVSIQLYLALERGIFIEFTRVHNQPKKTGAKPQTAHNKTTQTTNYFLLTSKIRLVNLQ